MASNKVKYIGLLFLAVVIYLLIRTFTGIEGFNTNASWVNDPYVTQILTRGGFSHRDYVSIQADIAGNHRIALRQSTPKAMKDHILNTIGPIVYNWTTEQCKRGNNPRFPKNKCDNFCSDIKFNLGATIPTLGRFDNNIRTYCKIVR